MPRLIGYCCDHIRGDMHIDFYDGYSEEVTAIEARYFCFDNSGEYMCPSAKPVGFIG